MTTHNERALVKCGMQNIDAMEIGLELEGKTTESDRHSNPTTNPVVRCGSLAKLRVMVRGAYMQNRVPNSQRYLVNAKPGINHSTNPTNPNGNSKQ